MIKNLFILPLFLVPNMGMGQTNPVGYSRFLSDDNELEKQEFILPDLKSLEVVNLQDASLVGQSQKSKIILACGNPLSFTLVDNASLLNYKVKSDTLYLVGKENHLTKLSYSSPEAIVLLPLERNDKLQNVFKGEGRYVDKYDFKFDGTCQSSWTKIRAFITPDGDSLKNVCCLNRTVDTSYRLKSNEDSTFVTKENEMYCFVEGNNWPILYQRQQIKPAGDIKSYYFPILINPENGNVISFHNVMNGFGRDRENSEKTQLEYELTNNMSDRTIRVTYKLSWEADITFILSSLDGIVFHSEKQHAQSDQQSYFSYNYSGLRRGQYAVYMEVDGTRYESKFNVR